MPIINSEKCANTVMSGLTPVKSDSLFLSYSGPQLLDYQFYQELYCSE